MTNPDRDELVKLADRLEQAGTIVIVDADLIDRNLDPAERAAIVAALRRLASSDSGVKVKPEPVAWVQPGKLYQYTDDEENGNIMAIDHQSGPFTMPLYAAPPADAGMREAVQQAIDEASYLASIHAHHALWHGLLPYGWDAATEQFGRNLAGAIAKAIKTELPKRLPALTAPGATFSKRQMLECILLSLNVDGVYLNSLTVGELRRAL